MLPSHSPRETRIQALLSDWQPDGTDENYMRCALELARIGASYGEVPVGAVLVQSGRLLCGDCNGRETYKNAVCHAELTTIQQACERLGGWRLTGCTLYVTLEPCPMCAGAIWNARISRVVYGAKDARAGAMGSLLNLNSVPLNWKPEVCGGVLADECRRLLQAFFREKRR